MPWRDLPGDDDSITPLASAINAIAGRLGAPDAAEIMVVFGVWDDAVGPQVAEHAQPAAIKKGALIVEVDDTRWATQLKWLAPQVLKQLNEALGKEVIEKLEIRRTLS